MSKIVSKRQCHEIVQYKIKKLFSCFSQKLQYLVFFFFAIEMANFFN
jgi:hypothetical protein